MHSDAPEETPPTRPPSLIIRPLSIVARMRFEELFPARQPVEVELGSGDGSFLAEYAFRHPERNFLGVERLLGRLRKLDRKGLRRGLKNLRLARIEAGYLADYLLPPASISALHIYFPDPWPKRKHRKNRLINPGFASVLERILAPGGRAYLRTDDEDYFSQMLEVFAGAPRFLKAETPADLSGVITDFERGFLARNVLTRHAAYSVAETTPGQLTHR